MELMDENHSNILVNFIVRAVVGMGVIFFTNEFLASRGISEAVGMNGLSFLTSGTLGIPGVCLLYGILLSKLVSISQNVESKNAYRQKEKMRL